MQSMNEAKTGRSWLTEAKQDINQWSASMLKNADNQLIDWQWVATLDLEHGIGAAQSQSIDCRIERRRYRAFADSGDNGFHAGFGIIRPAAA